MNLEGNAVLLLPSARAFLLKGCFGHPKLLFKALFDAIVAKVEDAVALRRPWVTL